MGTVPPPPEQQPPETVVPAQRATDEPAAEENGTPAAAADDTAREAPAVEEATPDASDAPPEPAGRRRGRLPLLLASAALLGIVAGVATGYTVQADRRPTALPPLSQHTLKYPKKRLSADEVTPLAAKHDHRVKTDGDLRKLLVPQPKGAQDSKFFPSQDGWAPLPLFLDEYKSPDFMFTNLTQMGFRRVARRAWEGSGQRDVLIDLVQFDDAEGGAAGFLAGQQKTMTGYLLEPGSEGSLLKGSADGRYWTPDKPDRKAGYLPMYKTRALARRGDIVMDVHIFDTKPISEKSIRELAERQLERL